MSNRVNWGYVNTDTLFELFGSNDPNMQRFLDTEYSEADEAEQQAVVDLLEKPYEPPKSEKERQHLSSIMVALTTFEPCNGKDVMTDLVYEDYMNVVEWLEKYYPEHEASNVIFNLGYGSLQAIEEHAEYFIPQDMPIIAFILEEDIAVIENDFDNLLAAMKSDNNEIDEYVQTFIEELAMVLKNAKLQQKGKDIYIWFG